MELDKFTASDTKGRKYFHVKNNYKTEAVLTWENKNIVFTGKSDIILRKGDSEFGEEIILQLYIDKAKDVYKTKTKHSMMEIYLPKDDGIKMLKEAIKYFEEQDNENSWVIFRN